MAFTTADYDTISSAIALGALEVKYADKTVTYRNLNDMLRARAIIADELGLNATSGNSRKVQTTFNKGLNYGSCNDNNRW
jgi:hypothetical protein